MHGENNNRDPHKSTARAPNEAILGRALHRHFRFFVPLALSRERARAVVNANYSFVSWSIIADKSMTRGQCKGGRGRPLSDFFFLARATRESVSLSLSSRQRTVETESSRWCTDGRWADLHNFLSSNCYAPRAIARVSPIGGGTRLRGSDILIQLYKPSSVYCNYFFSSFIRVLSARRVCVYKRQRRFRGLIGFRILVIQKIGGFLGNPCIYFSRWNACYPISGHLSLKAPVKFHFNEFWQW